MDRLVRRAAALLLLACLFCVPASLPVQGQNNSGVITCTASAPYDASTNGSTRLVASAAASGAGGGEIYVCGYIIATNTATNVKLIAGTGTNCATGTVALTPAYQFAVSTAGIASINETSSTFRGLSAPAGLDLCINTSAGNAVQAIVYFYQQR